MKSNWLHKGFRWNGKRFDAAQDLMQYASVANPDAGSFLSEWFSEAERIQVMTSGSTGTPKKIALQREQMMHSARATAAFFDLGPGTRALHCLPMQYIAGKMMLVRAMALGWQLYSVVPSTRLDIPEGITFDFAAMVSLQAYHNLDQLGKMKKLLIGGGELPQDLERSVQNLRTEVYSSYGMTETITHIAVRPVNAAAGADGNKAYRALPGVKFHVDERACLVVDAPAVSEHPVQTNDLVDLLSETEFHWLGRFDNVINSGGIKLIPEQIERQLKPLIAQRFFVAAEKHESLGEALVLVVEGPHQQELLSSLREARESGKIDLPAHALPKKVYFSDQFKETETGKVRRRSTLESIQA